MQIIFFLNPNQTTEKHWVEMKETKQNRAIGGNYPSNENIHLKDKTNSDAEGEVGETKRDSELDPLAIWSP